MKRDWAALAFAMLFPTALAWTDFVALARTPVTGDETLSRPNQIVIAVYSTGKVIQFLFPLIWVGLVERRRILTTGGNKPRSAMRGLAVGLVFGLLVGAGTLGLYHAVLRRLPLFQATPARVHDKMVEFGLGTPAAFILFGAFLCVLHSFLEEYYWRWFVFGRLRNYVPVAFAVLLSSVAFMSHHLIDLAMFFPGKFWELAVPLSICVGIGGAIFAWLYHRSGSLYAPWLSHVLIDAAVMVVGYDLAFGS